MNATIRQGMVLCVLAALFTTMAGAALEEPDYVLETRYDLVEAKQLIEPGDPGYDTLQDAENAYENEEYEQASALVAQAVAEYRDEMIDAEREPPIGFLYALFAVTTLAGLGYYTYRQSRDENR